MTRPYTLWTDDNRRVLPLLGPWSVDAIVTDPPYEIGFMGRAWDHTGIAYDPDVWAGAFRALKPGGHLLSFGATRTYHRMAVAIEDVGFAFKDQIDWIYGQGMPHGLDLGKALGDEWAGWNTQLKPAHEPIVLAQKPFDGPVSWNVLDWGTGGLNVGDSRNGSALSPGDARATKGAGRAGIHVYGAYAGGDSYAGASDPHPESARHHADGRYPPNVVLTHSPACLPGACHPSCPVALMDRQSGDTTGGKPTPNGRYGQNEMSDHRVIVFNRSLNTKTPSRAPIGDTGGSSRYFPVFSYSRADDEVFRYAAKASRAERAGSNDHATVKPLALMNWLVRLVTPPGGVVLDMFSGSGTTGVAAVSQGFGYIGIDNVVEHNEIAAGRLYRAERERYLDSVMGGPIGSGRS